MREKEFEDDDFESEPWEDRGGLPVTMKNLRKVKVWGFVLIIILKNLKQYAVFLCFVFLLISISKNDRVCKEKLLLNINQKDFLKWLFCLKLL